MRDLIVDYARNPENPQTNYNLALEYDRLGQTAAAISFYLRAADRANTDDFEMQDLAYRSMVKIALAFDKQQNRGFTVQGALKHAIRISSWRPEAYYHLSRYYEANKRFVDSYMTAIQGLNAHATNANLELNYPGKYALLFQQAVSAWWWGKSAETRRIMRNLADHYRDEMDEVHLQAVQNNLSTLGIGPETQAFRRYDSTKHNLVMPADWADFQNNHSQAFQDLFVLYATKGKRNGTYLEIGSAGPYHGNNTALLEQRFGWTGLGIDYNQNFVTEYGKHRTNPCICVDATKVDYDKLLAKIAVDGVVDYLQVDCEPPKVTFDVLMCVPLDKYKFRVISYEHDYYADVSRSYRAKSRRYLQSFGYQLVVPDVSVDGISSFEDWWVHPDLVDEKTIEALKSPYPNGDAATNIAEKFIRAK